MSEENHKEINETTGNALQTASAITTETEAAEMEPAGPLTPEEFRSVLEQIEVDPAARADVHQDEIPKDTEFERQKEAFKSIPPIFLAPYRGQFVAACNGAIVDSDNDLGALGRRFFEKHGDVPVYMTKVGDTIMVRIPTPFLR